MDIGMDIDIEIIDNFGPYYFWFYFQHSRDIAFHLCPVVWTIGPGPRNSIISDWTEPGSTLNQLSIPLFVFKPTECEKVKISQSMAILCDLIWFDLVSRLFYTNLISGISVSSQLKFLYKTSAEVTHRMQKKKKCPWTRHLIDMDGHEQLKYCPCNVLYKPSTSIWRHWLLCVCNNF